PRGVSLPRKQQTRSAGAGPATRGDPADRRVRRANVPQSWARAYPPVVSIRQSYQYLPPPLPPWVDRRPRTGPARVRLLRVDTEGRVDRREQAGGGNFAVHHLQPLVVGLPVHRPALRPAPGHGHAPRGGEVVAAQTRIDLRRPAELGERHHHHVVREA